MTQPSPQQTPTQEAAEDKLPKIIFYDVQHTLPPPFKQTSSWSPFTTRVALALRYRNLPYTRIPVSYPDIAALLTSKNVPPALDSEGKIDEVPYTLPAIDLIYSTPHTSTTTSNAPSENDTKTKTTTIMDSTPISSALETLLPPSPTHPSLFPLGEKSHAQVASIKKALNAPGLRKQIIPFIPAILDERGVEYFVRTRSERFGKGLEVVREEAQAEADEYESADGGAGLVGLFVDALKGVAGVYLEEAGQGQKEGEGGVFLGGSKVPSYADFVFVAAIQWWRCARGVEVVERALEECEGGILKRVFDACEGLLD